MSAFNLGSIRAFLGLDSSDYTKGILDAQVANEVFGQGVVNFVNNPLLGTIQLFKGLASSTIAAVRETAFLNQEYLRTSERLGVSTRTISGLQMAYRDVGLQSAEFEKQLTKLAIKVDEAAQGNETSANLFRRLGVSVTDASGNMRSLDDILRQVSDGMTRLGSQQEKASIGNLLFGESFVKVLSILGEGRRSIEDTIEKASRYGQVVEDDAARASNELASALGDLGFAVDGAKKRLATGFIKSFVGEFAGSQAAVDGLADSLKKIEPAATAAGAAFGRWSRDTVEGLGIVIEKYEAYNRVRDEAEARDREIDTGQVRSENLARRRGFLSNPLSYPLHYAYTQAVFDDELYQGGTSIESVRRAMHAHDPGYIADELAILHARQERMRALRARR